MSLLVGVLLCEMSLAIFYPQRKDNLKGENLTYHSYDPEIGWVNKNNVKVFDRPNDKEPQVRVEINSKGLRGKEFSYEKAIGRKRVLVLGDSITFGYALDEIHTYPFILQQNLGGKYEVVNAGVVGYGLDQDYLLFKREGVKYHPDILIVGFSVGDIYDSMCSMRYGMYKPYLKIVQGQLQIFNTPVPQKISIDKLLFRENSVRSFLFENTNLFRLFFYRFADLNKVFSMSTEELHLVEGRHVAMDIIRSLKKDCDRIGCKVIFLVIPQEDWIERAKNISVFEESSHNGAVALLAEAGVQYIDLWAPFFKNYSNKLFLKNDPVHPNQKGNKIIANEIYKRLTITPL